jgi:hypothetical protein
MCTLFLPVIGLKVSTLPNFALKSITKFCCGALRISKIHALVPHKSYPLYHHFYPQLGCAHAEQNITLMTS